MLGLKTRRIGQFKVNFAFFNKLVEGEGLNLFHNTIVLTAELKPIEGCIVYHAINPSFREIELGEITPEYKAVFDNTSPYPVWREEQ